MKRTRNYYQNASPPNTELDIGPLFYQARSFLQLIISLLNYLLYV